MKNAEGLNAIISKGVVCATENTPVIVLAQLMRRHNIGSVVILKEDKIDGIVTERDIVVRVVAKSMPLDITLARDIMTHNVSSVEMSLGIKKILSTLRDLPFRHLLITNKGKLVGIASQRDVLDSLKRQKPSKQ